MALVADCLDYVFRSVSSFTSERERLVWVVMKIFNVNMSVLCTNTCMTFERSRCVKTVPLLQGGSYEGEWRGGEREGLGIRTMRSGKVLAGMHSFWGSSKNLAFWGDPPRLLLGMEAPRGSGIALPV